MSGTDEPPVKRARSEVTSDTEMSLYTPPQPGSLPLGGSADISPSLQIGSAETLRGVTPRPVIISTTGSMRPVTNMDNTQRVTLSSQGSPRYPSPRVIALPSRPPVVTTARVLGMRTSSQPVSMVLTNMRDAQSLRLVSANNGDHVKVVSQPGNAGALPTVGQTQISFQVPSTWNSSAPGKSLLEPSKVSVVSFADPSTRSLLLNTDGTQKTVETVTPVNTSAVPLQKTYITGNKVIGNLGAGGVLTQSSPAVISVSRGSTIVQPSPQRTINKTGSFVISNKQYTIVPNNSNQVVTQIVKTDTKLNKGKVTMAEAQIMLPSGPAKISWPIHSQSNIQESSTSKQILITTPVIKQVTSMQGGKPLPQKSPISKTAIQGITTAKVVEGVPQKVTIQPNSASTVQKTLEPVKQPPQVLPTNQSPQPTAVTLNKVSDADSSSSKESDKHEPSPAVSDGTGVPLEPKPDLTTEEPLQGEENVKTPGSGDGTEMVAETSDDINDIQQSGNTIDETEGGEEEMNGEEVKIGDKTQAADDGTGAASTDVTPNTTSSPTWHTASMANTSRKMEDSVSEDGINDGLECDETLNTSDELDKLQDPSMTLPADSSRTPATSSSQPDAMQQEGRKTASNKDEIAQCENCSNYGFVEDFYKEGRFCSQSCVNAFNCRHMRDAKKQGTMSKVIMGMKKCRKRMLLKDGFSKDRDVKQSDPQSLVKKSKSFVWTQYLEQENAVEAPAKLFKNPFPSIKNCFRVGMKLEGVDPNHQSKFCVLSVAEVCGYRVRLHFDGYSECYDFWSDIDSPYIFPVGFCEKNGKELQPPKGFVSSDFSWTNYLKLTKSTPVAKSLFTNQPVQSVTPNLFRVGCKMEAIDKRNSSLVCVASVADTMGDKVLVHFDSWEDNYDYWCDMSSPLIHPTGYCEENELVLSPPQDWHDVSGFTWEKFLNKTNSQAVPARAFKPREMIGFLTGMKVEVVDKRNPLLVRVATIAETDNYMVLIHFDGWSDRYDYWLEDDSPDIHPPGWCAKTGHPLVPPISTEDLVSNSGPGVCPTQGCKGTGHIKGPKYSGHHSTFGCPYSEMNMNKECVVGDRLGREESSAGALDRNVQDTKQQSTDNVSVLKHGSTDHPKKLGRGRKPKAYHHMLEEQKRGKEECEENVRLGIHNSVFSSSLVCPPKPEVPLCWEQHCKLLPGVTNIRGNDVHSWTEDQVSSFVNTLPGCREHSKLFKEEQIDGEAFLLLTQPDLVKIMNIKLGPALKIFNSIVMFKNSIEV